jgi:hypothetical protein
LNPEIAKIMTSRQETYVQCADFERIAEAHSLSEELWLVAFALATPATPGELAESCGLPPDTASRAVESLLERGLIRRHTMTLKEFIAKRNASPAPAAQTPEVPTPSVAAVPPVEATQPAPIAPAAPAVKREPLIALADPEQSAAIVTMRIGRVTALQPLSDTPVFVLKLGTAIPAAVTGTAAPVKTRQAAKPSAKDRSVMKLRPVINAIETKGGGGIAGQLLVYRVFLRVPFGSLYDEGITSLKLVDENSAIRNPELQDAILDAAREIAGVELAA